MPADPSELLSRLRRRESEAFEQFIRFWSQKFEPYLRGHGFSPIDAMDIAFSCSTEAASRIDQFKREADCFDAWVWKVGKNFAEDQRRRRKGVVLVSMSKEVRAEDADPLNSLIARDTAIPQSGMVESLLKALRTVPAADYRLIEMRHLNGSASFKEIGEILGITEVAARVRHHRILMNVKALLEPKPNT